MMRSMTAYAYIARRRKSQTLQLILRSVNFKYLDVSIHNLSAENILLEEKIKREIKKRLSRGKVEVFVFLRGISKDEVLINEDTLVHYIRQTKRLAKKHNLSFHFDISNFLNLPRIISCREKQVDERFIFSALREGLLKLMKFKEAEGRAIKGEMNKSLGRLKDNIRGIKREKLEAFGTEEKEDIAEELSLISFYANDLEKKIESKKIIVKGKSIDFLTQEILRELNAASSKTKNKKVAVKILEAKNYLERIREQAQNVE